MATTSHLIGASVNVNAKAEDSVTLTYLVEYDAVQPNPYAALNLAASGGPGPGSTATSAVRDEFRADRGADFSGRQTSESRLVWEWTVTFSSPPRDEAAESGHGTRSDASIRWTSQTSGGVPNVR